MDSIGLKRISLIDTWEIEIRAGELRPRTPRLQIAWTW